MNEAGGILLATINAKWIHPSLALRLLKVNLGSLEEQCQIIEFALRQPMHEKADPIIAARPRILGLSVSIWNHTATLELLKELWKIWAQQSGDLQRPVIVLGGPEVSYLSQEAELFSYADYYIRGEGEVAFKELCEAILSNTHGAGGKVFSKTGENFHSVADLTAIKSAYHLYTEEDLHKKLTYVEASRGCPFSCEFCLSCLNSSAHSPKVREFPLEPFFMEMNTLISRGAQTFKFLDRTFNLNIERARRIMDFFLNKIAERTKIPFPGTNAPFVVHFEMIPSRFPPDLIETLARFPPGTLRLEIGIQTLNPEVSARIGRPSEPERELETLRLLREKTSAIIHADLIAGLPGEDLASFGRGFDLLWAALSPKLSPANTENVIPESTPRSSIPDPQSLLPSPHSSEIQLGILKLLPGTPIIRHSEAFGMHYNPLPPYEVIETAAITFHDLNRIKNFARFWELIVNRRLFPTPHSPFPPRKCMRTGEHVDEQMLHGVGQAKVTVTGEFEGPPTPFFNTFLALSDTLFAHFGRNWGIDKKELLETLNSFLGTFIVSSTDIT